MLDIGCGNLLEVIETRTDGVLLDGGGLPHLFLPIDQVTGPCSVGDWIEVFAYPDADGNVAVTTVRPAAQLGQVSWLRIVDVNQLGAFADWGLPKDLFIPFAQQQHPLRRGDHALVRIYLDNQGRLAGSTRIDRWIKDDATGLEPGLEVSLIIAERTQLGFKAVINHRSWGLLYGNELFKSLRKGQQTTGYIKRIRADGKIDLSLEKPGFSQQRLDTLGQSIIEHLLANGGKISLTDKSPPGEIYAMFGVSKKVFKQALGKLYKLRRVTLHDDGVRLVED